MSQARQKKSPPTKMKSKLRIGDEVVVISGKCKNSKGSILAMSLRSGKVLIQGVNFRKRFSPPSQEMPKGGVIETEAPLQLSNVQCWDSKSKKPSRIRYQKNQDGKKVRVLARSGSEL